MLSTDSTRSITDCDGYTPLSSLCHRK